MMVTEIDLSDLENATAEKLSEWMSALKKMERASRDKGDEVCRRLCMEVRMIVLIELCKRYGIKLK